MLKTKSLIWDEKFPSLLLKGEGAAAFLQGQCFDCGNPIGYFKSIIDVGLTHPELKKEFRKVISKSLK